MTESEKAILAYLNKLDGKLDKVLNGQSNAKKAETAAKKIEVEVVRFWVTAHELSKHTKWRGSGDYNYARENRLVHWENLAAEGQPPRLRYDLNSVHPDHKK